MKVLRTRIESIADKYAQLIERQLVIAINEDEVGRNAWSDIMEGIRILNHAMSVLERVDRLDRGNDAGGQEDD